MNAPLLQSTIKRLGAAREYAARASFGHVIGGSQERASSPLLDIINPATGDIIGKIARGTATDVDRAVTAARAAFPAWRSATPAGRAQTLFAMAAAAEEHADELIALESLNAGKPISVSTPEIGLIGDILRFHAGAARAMTAPSADEYTSGYFSVLRREPVGVVGAITPWNYPLLTAIFKLAAALAAGNTVVLKPAELTPLTTLRFMEIIADILPPGVVNVVLGTGPEVGSAMSEHPGIDLLSLTGSVGSGRAVLAASARTLRPTHLELGGKAPVVVFDDADIDCVAATLRAAGFWNTGQECGAATRVLCNASIAGRLTDALVEQARTIKVGGPESGEGMEMGPLISDRQLQNVAGLVARAKDAGATMALGGSPLGGKGFFFPPTIVAGAETGSEITHQEIFGPVITIETFSDEADAIAKSNAVDFGLSASIWTRDVGRSFRVSGALDFGTVWVNTHLVLAAEMPWGGFGSSGHGRELSILSIDDFSRTKHVMFSTGA